MPCRTGLSTGLTDRPLLYPERFPGDFDAAVREFFALFYQRDLSEEDLDYLHLRAR